MDVLSSRRTAFEALEGRMLLAVSLDDQGWTNFTRGQEARTIYVSSSAGSDRNSGIVSSKPVQTLAKARSLLRDGQGDWMLLKAGDVWYESLTGWTKSGKSKDEPLLISSYGRGERPVLETGASDGFTAAAHHPLRHVAVVGLLFHAHTRDPDSPSFRSVAGGYGFHTTAQLDDLLIENCVFDSYQYNIAIRGNGGPATHVGIRRNVVVDAYSQSGKSQGLYMSHAGSVLIEENVFDHNGWNERIPEGKATMFSHNIYLDETVDNVHVRGNVISNAASHGLQARGGGTVVGNLFLRNPIGLLFGNGKNARAGGVEGDVSGNVFLGAAGIGNQNRGWAIEVGNTRPGGTTIVANNIIAHDNHRHFPAIMLTGDGAAGATVNAPQTVGINDLLLEGNIVYRWNKGLSIDGALTPGVTGRNGLNNLVVRNNDFQRIYTDEIITQGKEIDQSFERFQGNRYFNNGDARKWFKKGGHTVTWDAWNAKIDKTSRRVKVKYDDPERKVETYAAMLGGKPTQGAFLTQARLLSRRLGDLRYAAPSVVEYMRQGFKVRKIPPTVKATNLSSRNTQPTRAEIFFLFDKDVSAKLKVGDLLITDRATGKSVKPSAMKLVYDVESNRATWTFPGLKQKRLATGDYNVTLSARVSDVKNTPLDGNGDGIAGDAFTRRLRIRDVL